MFIRERLLNFHLKSNLAQIRGGNFFLITNLVEGVSSLDLFYLQLPTPASPTFDIVSFLISAQDITFNIGTGL
jgi:hypothetical protein